MIDAIDEAVIIGYRMATGGASKEEWWRYLDDRKGEEEDYDDWVVRKLYKKYGLNEQEQKEQN